MCLLCVGLELDHGRKHVKLTVEMFIPRMMTLPTVFSMGGTLVCTCKILVSEVVPSIKDYQAFFKMHSLIPVYN